MVVAPAVIFVPVPVASRRGRDRDPNYRPAREGKTPTHWPREPQPIPMRETRRLLDEARRILARRKEEKAYRELAS
jgi:hypothetical protein